MAKAIKLKDLKNICLHEDKRLEILKKIIKEFESFVVFKELKPKYRSPYVIKSNALFLRKKLNENIHNSGIENCNTDFMLEQIGRGMIRYSRRIAWLLRHYEWASRIPVIESRRARVVDLGCDVGEIRKIMSGSFYYKNPLYVGIDLDAKRLSSGFSSIITSRTPALYIQHDLTLKLKFIKSGTVDAVIFGETIEHMDKKYGISLLKEIFRILKKEGVFFISTPVKRNSKGYDFHVYEYEPEELVDILESVGFSITRSYGWITSEKVLLKRMSKKDNKFYQEIIKKAHKDIVIPVFAHLDPNYGDAFCVEGRK